MKLFWYCAAFLSFIAAMVVMVSNKDTNFSMLCNLQGFVMIGLAKLEK